MKSKIKTLEKSQIEIEVEISSEELEQFVKKATERAQQILEVEGFRKGKAPKEIVEQKVGKEKLLVDAADLAIQENYKKIVLENNIEGVAHPEIDIIKLAPGNPLIFKAKVSILPEIKLGDYKKVAEKMKKNDVSVTEEEITSALKWLQKSRAKLTLKNAVAEKGDFVQIKYKTDAIKELNAWKEDGFILGEGRFMPGFEEELVGMKASEKKEFLVTMQKDHPLKDLAGKEVKFEVELNSVQNVELPEINDELAKSLGKFEKIEEVKKNIREGLISEKKQGESQKVRDEILNKLTENIKCEIPEALIKQEQAKMIENLKKDIAEKLKIPFEEYLKTIKKTEKEIEDSFTKEAVSRIKKVLILKEIAKKEEIEVSEKEIEERAKVLVEQYPNAKEIDFEQVKGYTKEEIKNEKVLAMLESFAK